ncbi:hypothetical protein SAMN06297251_10130 [Fulvimarina manganoxydans]|uniref:Helix-turn-helix domain-containing protein n=1 Tax=Fulvimarina manganoxydans TaxID=937218 RepID=A0A1W1Y9B0_9HYPH|nr:hypothetical protein SAMN06297251_10130 [Fulvimarina manganoxydans]
MIDRTKFRFARVRPAPVGTGGEGVNWGMRARPASVETLLETLSVALGDEIRRRGMTYADVARRLRWTRQRTHDLRAFVDGDTRALGVEAAMRVSQTLGVPVVLSVGRPPLPDRRVAA